MNSLITLTDKNFAEIVEKSESPVLVDFWSAWCAPCKIQMPIVEEISKDYAGRIKTGKIEAGENPDIPAKYKVMSIPTIAIFKKGKLIETRTGLQNKNALKKMIDKVI